MLDAFASDTFDAASMKMSEGKSEMMRKRLQREVDGLNTALPLLDDEQKTQLAKLLREGPKHPHKRHGRHGRGGPEAK